MIFVITHKRFDERVLREHYQILHVGSGACSSDIELRDDSGEDNISCKNANYCELTGLYWIWKNYKCSKTETIGIVHYRRFFVTWDSYIFNSLLGISPKIILDKRVTMYLNNYDIILPSPVHLSTTIKENYAIFHQEEDLLITRNIISDLYPDYLPAYDKVMRKYSFYFANMMICKKEIFDNYCSWLFPILSNIEKTINIKKYKNDYQKRVFGFLSERLLNVWVEKNNLSIKCLPVYNTESNRIGFLKHVYLRCKTIFIRLLIKSKKNDL